MKLQLLPSTFEPDGTASQRQHLSCLVINDRIAVDAGSLAMAATDRHRDELRDVIITHAHLDHIAGLPLFVDDLFAQLKEPVRIYALPEVIDILERDVFNWHVFPRFSELSLGNFNAVQYSPLRFDENFKVCDVEFRLFQTDHKVPSCGIFIREDGTCVAVSGDTATLEGLHDADVRFDALCVECAFPDDLSDIAKNSRHMTPSVLARELGQLKIDCPVFVFNIKANYRETVVRELNELRIPNLAILETGKSYFW